MLEGPESPKSAHKLVLPENVAVSILSCVFLCETGSLNANLVMVTLPPPPPQPRWVQITIFINQKTLLRVLRAFLTIHLLT